MMPLWPFPCTKSSDGGRPCRSFPSWYLWCPYWCFKNEQLRRSVHHPHETYFTWWNTDMCWGFHRFDRAIIIFHHRDCFRMGYHFVVRVSNLHLPDKNHLDDFAHGLSIHTWTNATWTGVPPCRNSLQAPACRSVLHALYLVLHDVENYSANDKWGGRGGCWRWVRRRLHWFRRWAAIWRNQKGMSLSLAKSAAITLHMRQQVVRPRSANSPQTRQWCSSALKASVLWGKKGTGWRELIQ